MNTLIRRADEHTACPLSSQRVRSQNCRTSCGDVRNEKQGLAGALEPDDAIEALGLKRLISHREDLVDNQDVGIDVHGDGKGQPHVHAARVRAEGLMDEIADSGEFDDFVEAGFGLPAAQSQESGIQEDVFRSGQIRMEAGAQFEKGRHAARHGDAALSGLAQSGDETQQGALAGAVAAHDGQGFAALHLKGDVLESVEDVRTLAARLSKSFFDVGAQKFGPAAWMAEHFRDVFELDEGHIRGNRRSRA